MSSVDITVSLIGCETVQHLARFIHKENTFVFPVAKGMDVNVTGIHITEIDAPAQILGYGCCKYNLDSRFLDTTFKSTETTHMGRMGNNTSRYIIEALHV